MDNAMFFHVARSKVIRGHGLHHLVNTAVVTCGRLVTEQQPDEEPMLEKTVEEVLKEHSDSLMALPGVVGIAQGEFNGEPCLKVFTVKKSPDLLEKIPQVLGGYQVILEETGGFQALGQ
jgi:hypothetical protein